MTPLQEEIRRRMRVAVWAYAYEVLHVSLVPDHVFDEECLKVDTKMSTSYEGRDNAAIDEWFKDNFDPSTGMWVLNHPRLDRISGIAESWIKDGRLQ